MKNRGLRLIAAFKFLKAAALMAAGLAALGLLSPARTAPTEAWLARLALGHGHRLMAGLAEHAAAFIHAGGVNRLVEVAIGAFLYAGIFIVEGIGLVRTRRWAEYLTLFTTTSYLPLEALALWHHPAPVPAVAIVLNIAVVSYLLVRLWLDRQGRYITDVSMQEHRV